MSTYQHYDPLFGPPPRTLDLVPEADPKQRHRRRGRRSGLLVRLRRPTASEYITRQCPVSRQQGRQNKGKGGLPERHQRLLHSLFHGNMALSGYVVGDSTATWFLHASCRHK